MASRRERELVREVEQLRAKLSERNQQLALANQQVDLLESKEASRLSPEGSDVAESPAATLETLEDSEDDAAPEAAAAPGSDATVEEHNDDDDASSDGEPGEEERAVKAPLKTYEQWMPDGRALFIWRCCDCYAELEDGGWCRTPTCGVHYDLGRARAGLGQVDGPGEMELDGDSTHPGDGSEDALEEAEEYDDELLAASPFYQPDRCTHPRSTTPLLTVPPILTPLLFSNTTHSPALFSSLLARGCSPRMIALYQLEFSDKGGIVAWADEDVFQAFSGDEMKQGDQWKICLGRRVKLDNKDADGSAFVHELLDDVYYGTQLSTIYSKYRNHRRRFQGPGGHIEWVTSKVVDGDTLDPIEPSIFETKRVVTEANGEVEDSSDWDGQPMSEAEDGWIPGPITQAEPDSDMTSDDDSDATTVDWSRIDHTLPIDQLEGIYQWSGDSSMAGSDWDSDWDSQAEQEPVVTVAGGEEVGLEASAVAGPSGLRRVKEETD